MKTHVSFFFFRFRSQLNFLMQRNENITQNDGTLIKSIICDPIFVNRGCEPLISSSYSPIDFSITTIKNTIATQQKIQNCKSVPIFINWGSFGNREKRLHCHSCFLRCWKIAAMPQDKARLDGGIWVHHAQVQLGWRPKNTVAAWWFGCHFWHFPIYWVSNHPNWRSYFSEGWPNHQPDSGFVQKVLDIFVFFFFAGNTPGPVA